MEKTNFCILLYLVFLASLSNSQDYKYDDYDYEDYADDYLQSSPCTCPPNPPPLPCIPPPIPPPLPMGKMIFFSILNMMKYRLTCSLYRGLNVLMDDKVIYGGLPQKIRVG